MELGLLRSLDRNLTCLNLDGTNGEVDGIARSECGRQPVCGELLICVENQQFATHRPRTKQAPTRVERGIVEDGLAALQPG